VSRQWVALLYSIVVAGGRRVRNEDLVALAEGLGFARPRTLLATGNLIFEAEADHPRGLEAALEPAFAAGLGRPVDIIVRAGDRWPALVRGNPFAEAAERSPAQVAVRVMRTPAEAAVLERLEPYRAEGERLAIVEGDLWVHLPHGAGNSRLAAAITPARAGGAGTFRNWNTVRRIADALGAP
jgi:uncharacterized protein (DUF1697 family)